MSEGNLPAIDLAPQISCPVIGFLGNDDENLSSEDVDDYGAALSQGGVELNFFCYDNTSHSFQSFNSEEKFRREASEDSWDKVLEFFQQKI